MSKELTLIDAAYDYWDWIQKMIILSESISLEARLYATYSMDDRRKEYHDILCAKLGLPKEKTTEITDNIDRYDCFEAFFDALKKAQGEE